MHRTVKKNPILLILRKNYERHLRKAKIVYKLGVRALLKRILSQLLN